MSNLSPAAILYNSSGTEIATGANPVRIDPTGVTVQPTSNTSGSQADGHSATIGSTADTDAAQTVIGRLKAIVSRLPSSLVGGRLDTNIGTWLGSAAPTVGQKSMTSSLPVVVASDQTTIASKIRDANDVAMDMARNTAIPAGSRGFLVMGQDDVGKAQVVDIRIDSLDSTRRLQVGGKVSVVSPSAPPSTTPVTIAADSPLSISSTLTQQYTISNNKTFYIQQIACGSEGDPTEAGSAIEISYFDGTTEHLVERIYVSGFTQYGILPDTGTARDGTVMTGNGSTKKIYIKRRRLSGSSQEVDAVVRGYEA